MPRQAVAKAIGSQVCWVQTEAARLPLADSAFDWVVCANSLHYFRQPAAALREMSRVLRPGGSLVLVDWRDDKKERKWSEARSMTEAEWT